MRRMYIAQQCLGLSVEGIEDAIDDIGSVRHFVSVNLSPRVGTCCDDAALVSPHARRELCDTPGLRRNRDTLCSRTFFDA